MKSLVKDGKSIIIITHKLKEIMRACDRCTIIRKGEGIGTVNVADTNTTELATMMDGRSISFETEKAKAKRQDTILKINDRVEKDRRKLEKVIGVDLEDR